VLASLGSGFDKYLLEPENLNLLFIALNDQVFKVWVGIELINSNELGPDQGVCYCSYWKARFQGSWECYAFSMEDFDTTGDWLGYTDTVQ